MNQLFNKLENKLNDLNLLQSVEQEKIAEQYRLAEKAVIMCKQVLQTYETEFRRLGFSVSARYNTHYFEFSISSKNSMNFPTIEISIANYQFCPVFYLKVHSKTVEIDRPKIDAELNEIIFTQWLDNNINRYFNL